MCFGFFQWNTADSEKSTTDEILKKESDKRKLVYGRKSRELRIKPVETEFGEKKVTIVSFFTSFLTFCTKILN